MTLHACFWGGIVIQTWTTWSFLEFFLPWYFSLLKLFKQFSSLRCIFSSLIVSLFTYFLLFLLYQILLFQVVLAPYQESIISTRSTHWTNSTLLLKPANKHFLISFHPEELPVDLRSVHDSILIQLRSPNLSNSWHRCYWQTPHRGINKIVMFLRCSTKRKKQAVGKCVPKPVKLNVKTDTPSFQPPWEEQIGLNYWEVSNIGGGGGLQFLTVEEV